MTVGGIDVVLMSGSPHLPTEELDSDKLTPSYF